MFPTKISAGAGEEAAEMDGRVVQQELSEQQLLGVQGDQGDHTVITSFLPSFKTKYLFPISLIEITHLLFFPLKLNP